MFASKSVLTTTLLLAALTSGCAVAGAGIMQGVPGAGGNTPVNTQASPGVAQPQNGSSANKPAVSVTTNTDSMVIQVKRTSKVQGTVTYADGTKDGNIALSSTDDTIVSVNSTTGEIAGVKEGTATIQVKSASDPTKFANVTVTVRPGVVEDLAAKVTPSKTTVAVGDTVQLKATITDSDTDTNGNGTWSSSNKNVAFVNDSGLVTGRAEGTATITFTSAKDPTVTATSKITVGDEEEDAE